MDISRVCKRIREAANEYEEFLRDGNTKDAEESLARIRKLVSLLGSYVKDGRMDGAFFADELDGKHGERNVIHP